MKKAFKDYLRIIFKYFYVVALIMALSGIATLCFIDNLTTYYESESMLLIEDGNEYNYNNYKTYTSFIKESNLIDEVKNYFHLENTSDIKVDLLKNTKLVRIYVKNQNMDKALNINKYIVNVYIDEINKIYKDINIYTIMDTKILDVKTIDRNLYLGMSIAIGFVLGSFLVATLIHENVNIKNHEDLQKYLDLKLVGIVPDGMSDTKKKKRKKTKENLKFIDEANSIVSESYRMIRTNLDFLDLRVVNFTSTNAGEGKTETITNLALSFSMIGKKVLLIDCDLRKPKIHKNFGLNRALGLSDIVVYNRLDEYEDIIQTFNIKNTNYKVDVLTSGSKVVNPAELLSSKRFATLLNKLKDVYDLILIDCPPVSLMTDAAVVSKLANGTVYVIEYDFVNCAAINASLESLKSVNANILGAVITKVNIKKQKKLYGNKYEYYYNNYIS